MEPAQPTDRFEAVNETFADALSVPGADRSKFVEERCGGDVDLKRSVLRLLGKFEQIGDFLEVPPLAPIAPLQPGDLLATRFRIVRKLGSGGMGEVYEAHDQMLDEAVALKTILCDLGDDPEMGTRFRQEIRLARKVSHPNVCRVFDIFSDSRGGVPFLFFTMELLGGETLAARIEAAGRLEPELAITIAEQIAAGLDAAHREGVLHRDLKPGNVMLVPDARASVRAVIADFGLARALDAPAGQNTQAGQVLGSILYMAPEQLLGDEVSAAADLYSLGLIIFEMIAGRRPFPDETVLRAAIRRISEDAPLLSTAGADAPRARDRVLARALSRDPACRQKSARELIGELKRSKSRRYPSRRVLLRTAAGASIMAVSAGISRFYLWRPPRLPIAPVIMFTNASTSGTEGQAATAFALLIERQLDPMSITSLAPARVHQIWARMRGEGVPLPNVLDPRQAREISARAGANMIAFTGATRKLEDWSFWVRLELLGSSSAAPVAWWEHEFRTASSGDRFTASIEAAQWVGETVRASAPKSGFRQRTPQELTTSNWEALEEFTLAQDSHGDPNAAMRHLKTALDLDPEFALAASRMADLLSAAGRVDDGLGYYARATELIRRKNLTDLESLRMQTLFALDTGQAAQALESASRWAAEAPRDFEPLVHQATELEWMGNADAARHLLDRAIELSPTSRSPRMRRAILALHSGDFNSAAKDCDRLFAIPPTDSTWQLKSALDFAHLDMDGVLHSIEQMLRAAVESVRSAGYSVQACLCAERGRLNEAAQALEQGIRFERERASVAGEIKKRRLLAQLFLLDRRESDARRQCRLALAANPGHAATMEIGCVLAQAGDLVGARDCLRRGLPDWPIYGHWLSRLRGEIALASGNAKKALELMSAAPPDPAYAEAEWPAFLVRAAHAAGRREVLKPILNSLLQNPGRYWFNADFTGPGFISSALDHYAEEIDSSLTERASAIRRALANSK